MLRLKQIVGRKKGVSAKETRARLPIELFRNIWPKTKHVSDVLVR
jgi:hypothetical protein